jgi:hypothetical protein
MKSAVVLHLSKTDFTVPGKVQTAAKYIPVTNDALVELKHHTRTATSSD